MRSQRLHDGESPFKADRRNQSPVNHLDQQGTTLNTSNSCGRSKPVVHDRRYHISQRMGGAVFIANAIHHARRSVGQWGNPLLATAIPDHPSKLRVVPAFCHPRSPQDKLTGITT